MKTGKSEYSAEDAVMADVPRKGGYGVMLTIPDNLVQIRASGRDAHTDVAITLPFVEELDLSSIRKQLEPSHPERVINEALEAMAEAFDDVMVPRAFRRFINRG